MKTSNILLLSALSFISGAVLAVFLLMNVLGPAEKVKPPQASLSATPTPVVKSPAFTPDTLDLDAEIQPHSLLSPAPKTSNLLPQPQEARQIIDLLRSGFLDSVSLISFDLNEQNLSALMLRLQDKVKISEEPVITPDPKQISLLELLPHNIGYWRPAEFSSKETERGVAQWEKWQLLDFAGLILDLRNFKDANDLLGAVSLAGLFSAPQTALFTVEGVNTPQQVYKTEHQPLGFKKAFPLLILINQNTRGTGEALAWSLRQYSGAILVGQATAGEGGLFTETRLKSGRFLRLASARLVTPTGISLLDAPLQPDILITTDSGKERIAFSIANKSNLLTLIAERPSHRRNTEYEVINFDSPDTSGFEAKNIPCDITLQRAVDILHGIVVNQRKPEIKEN